MAEFKSFVSGETESQFRKFWARMFKQSATPGLVQTGVLGSGSDLLVAQTTTASASVTVSSGVALTQDTVGSGVSPLVNDASKTLDVLGANPMGATPRNDLVVFDAATSSIRVIVGTPNAVPTDPAVPSTAVVLARLRHAASATTVPSSKIDDLRSLTSLLGVASSTPGRTYRTVVGALRNTGSGWGWIDDSGHRPFGFGAVTQSATGITIAYDFAGVKVGALAVAPDETLAARGIRAGASVGLSSAVIQMYDDPTDRITDRVYYDGSWKSESGVFTGFSWSGGVLTLTHENMGSPTAASAGVALGGRGSAIEKVGNLTATTTQVVFYNGSGGSLSALSSPTTQGCNVHVTRFGKRAAANVAPLNPSSVSEQWGNLWVIGEIEL